MDRLRVIVYIANVILLLATATWLIYDVSERIGEKKNLRTPHPSPSATPSPQGEGFGASGKNNTEEE